MVWPARAANINTAVNTESSAKVIPLQTGEKLLLISIASLKKKNH